MSIFRVELTELAVQDITLAGFWIAQHNPSAALRWRAQILTEIGTLTEFPTRFPLARGMDQLSIGIRQMVFGKKPGQYRILFQIKGSSVRVLRVVHGRRDGLSREDLGSGGR